METKTNKERFFSIELNSKSNLKSINMTNGSHENVLIEGTIGELLQVSFTEGIILEVTGKKGVLRLEIAETEIQRRTDKQ